MSEELYRELLESFSQLASNPKKDYGFLGYNPGSGFSVFVPDRPHLYRVTMDDGTFVEMAHNGRVAPIPRMRVIVHYDDQNIPFIFGVDQSWLSQFGSNVAAVANVGVHSHHRGSGMEFPIDWRLLYQLGPRQESGMTVRVVEGHFYYEGLKYFEGGIIDLTPFRPNGVQQHRWVVVCLLVTTSVTITAYAGTPVSSRFALDPSQIVEVQYPDNALPLFAVRVADNSPQIRDADFISLYGLVGSASAASSNIISVDRIITHDGNVVVDDNGKVVYDLAP